MSEKGSRENQKKLLMLRCAVMLSFRVYDFVFSREKRKIKRYSYDFICCLMHFMLQHKPSFAILLLCCAFAQALRFGVIKS